MPCRLGEGTGPKGSDNRETPQRLTHEAPSYLPHQAPGAGEVAPLQPVRDHRCFLQVRPGLAAGGPGE